MGSGDRLSSASRWMDGLFTVGERGKSKRTLPFSYQTRLKLMSMETGKKESAPSLGMARTDDERRRIEAARSVSFVRQTMEGFEGLYPIGIKHYR